MSTLPFTEEDIKAYLDDAIRNWRERKIKADDPFTPFSGDDKLIASCYIDAFQSVRMSLFGDLLPKED